MISGKGKHSLPGSSSMSSERHDPCQACSADQRCCSHLSGLRLSKGELENYFSDHSNELAILKDNKMFIVSSNRNGPCPHWKKSKCTIYSDRPIDCRLYPYEITRLLEKRNVLEVTFRYNPDCPQKDILFMPVGEAKALIEALCQTVYGRSKPILTKYVQARKGGSPFFVFFDPIRAWLSKIIEAFR